MNRLLTPFFVAVWFLCAVSPALSSPVTPLTFNLDYNYTSNPSPTGTGITPWLTATFENGPSNTVRLTMSTSGLSLLDDQKVKGWYFNIGNESLLGGLAFTYVSGQAASLIGQYPAGDAYKAGGQQGHGFDIYFGFPTSRRDFFGAGETSVYDITGSGLAASLFNLTNKDGQAQFFSAAHVLSIGKDNTSAFVAAVPLPGAVWMLGAGLIGLVAIRHRPESTTPPQAAGYKV